METPLLLSCHMKSSKEVDLFSEDFWVGLSLPHHIFIYSYFYVYLSLFVYMGTFGICLKKCLYEK